MEMSEKVNIKGTELLAIQYLMDGSNSGVSYDSFQLADMDSASFTGSESANLHDEDLVQQASQSGQLCHLRFYRNFNNPVGEDYPVQVQIYNDGHVRTTKPVEPDFLDELVTSINEVLDFRHFLTPLNTLLESYIYQAYRTSLPGEINLQIEETKAAFRNVVSQYFSSNQYQGDERHIYEALIANFGIELNRIDDIRSSSYPDLSPYPDFPNENHKIDEFLNDYARTIDRRTGYNFDLLSAHLHDVLEKNWSTPIEMIEFIVETYDIKG